LELPPRVLTIATEAACNAFAAHASISQAFIESGRARYVLSVHSSAMNRVVRRTEPDSAWWGDGAAAVLWGPVSSGRGILSAVHRADGSSGEAIVLGVPGGRWWDDGAITLHSPNREQTRSMLFNIADRSREAITASLKDAGVSPAQVGFYASHQGTAWLSEVTAQHSGLGATPTIATFPAFGNISSVNIPLILAIAERERAIKDDTNIVTFSGGAGETWSSLCLRWGR